MSQDEPGKDSVKSIVMRHSTRLFRAAARIQYMLLQSETIDLADEEKVEELTDFLHDSVVEADQAIEILKELEK